MPSEQLCIPVWHQEQDQEKILYSIFSSLAFQADSREIMQYLHEGNLISSVRQTHPHPINN